MPDDLEWKIQFWMYWMRGAIYLLIKGLCKRRTSFLLYCFSVWREFYICYIYFQELCCLLNLWDKESSTTCISRFIDIRASHHPRQIKYMISMHYQCNVYSKTTLIQISKWRFLIYIQYAVALCFSFSFQDSD